MTREELRTLVETLAARPEEWREHVHHDPERRSYAEILRDDDVSVWVLCWGAEQDTGFHDHDRSSGAVAVVSGAVREERLALGGGTVGRVVPAGESFDFGPEDIHRVMHDGAEPAVSLHAYSPPLEAMGAYLVEPSGVLRRFVQPASDELAPLAVS
jgi:predicted metal-dependent enzyme (double-stranded beta helix superfamily)